MAILSLDEALGYLGIDYGKDDAAVTENVTRAISAAERILRGAVGEDVDVYFPNDARIKQLVLIYLDDLYSERGLGAKVGAATRRLVSDMEWQLRLELREARRRESGGGSV